MQLLSARVHRPRRSLWLLHGRCMVIWSLVCKTSPRTQPSQRCNSRTALSVHYKGVESTARDRLCIIDTGSRQSFHCVREPVSLHLLRPASPFDWFGAFQTLQRWKLAMTAYAVSVSLCLPLLPILTHSQTGEIILFATNCGPYKTYVAGG